MIDFWTIILVLLATLIGAVGALLLKKGMMKEALLQSLKSWILWAGFFLYGLSTIFYILALKRGELSVIYPLVSTSYIWTTLLSLKYLGEKMNRWTWLGLAGIILGVFFIGFGS